MQARAAWCRQGTVAFREPQTRPTYETASPAEVPRKIVPEELVHRLISSLGGGTVLVAALKCSIVCRIKSRPKNTPGLIESVR